MQQPQCMNSFFFVILLFWKVVKELHCIVWCRLSYFMKSAILWAGVFYKYFYNMKKPCAAMGFLFAVALYDTKSGPSKSFNTFSNLKPMKITFGNWIEKVWKMVKKTWMNLLTDSLYRTIYLFASSAFQ